MLQQAEAPLHVLTGDLMLLDRVMPLRGDDTELAALINSYNAAHPDSPIEPGSKTALNRDEFKAFASYAATHAPKDSPGGSSANTLVTLMKMLDNGIKGDFFGVIGTEPHAAMVLDSFRQDGIRVHDAAQQDDVTTPVSFVFVDDEGKRSILTYRGNGQNKIREVIPDPASLLQDTHNVLFLQGSMWQKFGDDFANAFTRKRWQDWEKNEKPRQLWLALPTHTQFGDPDVTREQERNLFKFIIPSANVVMSNTEELQRLCTDSIKGLSEPDAKLKALEQIQMAFREGELIKTNFPEMREQVAFVTDGEKGAYIITKDNIEHVDAMPLNGRKIINTLGAGDTSFAGFLAGYVDGLDFKDCAKLGMALAGAKLQEMSARLPDPNRALEDILKETDPDLLSRMQGRNPVIKPAGSFVDRMAMSNTPDYPPH